MKNHRRHGTYIPLLSHNACHAEESSSACFINPSLPQAPPQNEHGREKAVRLRSVPESRLDNLLSRLEEDIRCSEKSVSARGLTQLAKRQREGVG